MIFVRTANGRRGKIPRRPFYFFNKNNSPYLCIYIRKAELRHVEQSPVGKAEFGQNGEGEERKGHKRFEPAVYARRICHFAERGRQFYMLFAGSRAHKPRDIEGHGAHNAAERERHTSAYPFKFGDGRRHIVLFVADYYYIVAVVRDCGCHGAAFQTVALYKPQPYPYGNDRRRYPLHTARC